MSIDPDFKRAREHVAKHGPLPPSACPRADILDGVYDTSPFVQGPLAAIKLGRALQEREDTIVDLDGHITDAVQDASLAYLGRVMSSVNASYFAKDIIAKMTSLKPQIDTREREHWATEQIKRVVLQAGLDFIKDANSTSGSHMAQISRRAADRIIHLLLPAYPHRGMTTDGTPSDEKRTPGGRFDQYETQDLAAQCRMQARDNLDPEYSQFMDAVANRLEALSIATVAPHITQAADTQARRMGGRFVPNPTGDSAP
jgi:hypothetical protein